MGAVPAQGSPSLVLSVGVQGSASMGCSLRESTAALRLQAIVVCTVAFFLASTLPAVSYYYVFRFDNLYLGPQAWGHWAVVLVACLLGIVAHGTASAALIALHLALGGMLGAALGGYNTAFWFTMDLSCQTAKPDPVCEAVLARSPMCLLAFTGLTTVVCLAVPACYSALVLCRSEAARAVQAAKQHTLCFAVDTQTSLVASGDKPTVTPAMLQQWVEQLRHIEGEQGDALCGRIAERCREALAQHGYYLPVKGEKAEKVALPSSEQGSRSPSVTFYLEPQGGAHGGRPPAKPPRRPQVAAEEFEQPRMPSQTMMFPAY